MFVYVIITFNMFVHLIFVYFVVYTSLDSKVACENLIALLVGRAGGYKWNKDATHRREAKKEMEE